MIKGLSTNLHCTNKIDCLLTNSIGFVGRYYSTTTQQSQKRITKAEALALSHAGIDIVVFYQDRMNQIADFSTSKGTNGGKAALGYASDLGQPHGSTIYFSADFDPSHSQILGPIKDYFAAVNQVFADAGSPFKIGVYSSGLACRLLKEANLVEHTCLSQSGGFNETKAYRASNQWNVLQTIAHANLCGFTPNDYEPCEAQGGKPSGSFRLGGAVAVAPQSGWTLRVGNNAKKLPCVEREGKTFASLRDFLTLIFTPAEVENDLKWSGSFPLYQGNPLGFDVVVINSVSYAWVRDLARMMNLQVEVTGTDILLKH